jgi:hypothetical protein
MTSYVTFSHFPLTNFYISLCLLLQEAHDGVEPRFIDVYMEGHRGPDP